MKHLSDRARHFTDFDGDITIAMHSSDFDRMVSECWIYPSHIAIMKLIHSQP